MTSEMSRQRGERSKALRERWPIIDETSLMLKLVIHCKPVVSRPKSADRESLASLKFKISRLCGEKRHSNYFVIYSFGPLKIDYINSKGDLV